MTFKIPPDPSPDDNQGTPPGDEDPPLDNQCHPDAPDAQIENPSDLQTTQRYPYMYFRILNQREKQEFRQWAHQNYSPGDTINGYWHPEVQKECVKINHQHAGYIPDGSGIDDWEPDDR